MEQRPPKRSYPGPFFLHFFTFILVNYRSGACILKIYQILKICIFLDEASVFLPQLIISQAALLPLGNPFLDLMCIYFSHML